ncbi:regulator of nonsense transcripts 3B [Drosophila tropicalis]|uniref:regulator of nonsense transcripts 3B n=1 Tax=Drosophila tropicalis TaxID=46794 RepID=UPI0035AB92C5
MSESTSEEKKKPIPVEKPRSKNKAHNEIKIVVRHLPPTMTEKEFLDHVDPLPEIDSYYYCPADWTLGQEASCRAYINMSTKNIEEVLQFRDRFDGYVFLDAKGDEYVAIVEYAPFQCFAKNKARSYDNKVDTIESESHFQEFVQKFIEDKEEASRLGDVKIDISYDDTDDEVQSTPLLQYLANKKEKRREDKRKQREEQKQQRLLDQSKNNNSKDGNNKNKRSSNAKKDPQQQQQQQGQNQNEPNKSSRSHRRTERDQRRREEHEQKKLMRDREQRDKKKGDKPAKQQRKPKGQPKTDMDITILKKDTKPAQDALDADSTTFPDITVWSGANAKDNDQKVPVDAKKEETKKPATKNSDSGKSSKQRSLEDRRIRNKDRPSIAIYQPKARMRLGSDENSQSTAKLEGCASEGEASLVEEKSYKKKRRSGKRNRSKPSEAKDHPETENVRRVSKSSESSNNSANSLGVVNPTK